MMTDQPVEYLEKETRTLYDVFVRGMKVSGMYISKVVHV